MPRAFMFPGQGSQAVGMGKPLAEAVRAARAVFEEVDDALGQHLSRLMWQGPSDELTLTENAQPALMAASLAVMRALASELHLDVAVAARYVAGHSLGEYSALAAAGALSVGDAARLLKARGQAMQKAVPVGAGAMAAILGLDFAAVVEIARAAAGREVCEAANDNAPGQVVVSGSKAAVDRAMALAKERGAKRALLLTVSAPFHCALMAPAATVMAERLADAVLVPPRLPIVANVTARPTSDPARIKTLLVEQVTKTVRWRESIEFMAADGIDVLVEVGAGKVLSGLAKRIHPDATIMAVETPEDINALAKIL